MSRHQNPLRNLDRLSALMGVAIAGIAVSASISLPALAQANLENNTNTVPGQTVDPENYNTNTVPGQTTDPENSNTNTVPGQVDNSAVAPDGIEISDEAFEILCERSPLNSRCQSSGYEAINPDSVDDSSGLSAQSNQGEQVPGQFDATAASEIEISDQALVILCERSPLNSRCQGGTPELPNARGVDFPGSIAPLAVQNSGGRVSNNEFLVGPNDSREPASSSLTPPPDRSNRREIAIEEGNSDSSLTPEERGLYPPYTNNGQSDSNNIPQTEGR